MNRYIAGAIFTMLFSLAGCSSTHHSGRQPDVILFSPNGEPLNGGVLGRPTCPDAMGRWFNNVDINHDDVISEDEFIADAQILFQRMDIDKNGYLLAEEVDRFRLSYQPQSAGDASAQTSESPQAQQTGRHGRGRGGSRGGSSSSTSNTGKADQPDPVMSADTNNDLKVTLEEFVAHAHATFAKLDTDHNGTLSRDEVLKLCEKNDK